MNCPSCEREQHIGPCPHNRSHNVLPKGDQRKPFIPGKPGQILDKDSDGDLVWSDQKSPREFFIAFVHRYVEGQHESTRPVVIENPKPDDLENNGIHVIEYSAYHEKNRRLSETNGFLHDKHMENQKLQARVQALREALLEINLYGGEDVRTIRGGELKHIVIHNRDIAYKALAKLAPSDKQEQKEKL